MEAGWEGWLDDGDSPFLDGCGVMSIYFGFWWAGMIHVKVVRYSTYVELFEGSVIFGEKWIRVCRKCRLY